MQKAIESVTLYYRSGSSDKVYQASIEPAGSGRFQVAFAYGRRGTTLKTGIKTAAPVDYFKARAVFDKGRRIGCGNVTIPAGRDIPGEGSVVEVRYLYAYPESNALYQPVYLGPRNDLEPADCELDQLRYKAA